jgi:hypothetical protein
MIVVGWKAWYTRYRVYSSDIHTWEELPKEGVLVVLIYFDEKDTAGDHYREIIKGRRRYFKAIGSANNEFYKGSLWNEAKILRTYDTKEEWIKEGIWDDDATMETVIAEALATKL